MPSLETARRIASVKNNGAQTIGQVHKENADFAMEATWDNDYQSKVCYIYDYFHDDQPRLKDHMTYEHTTKTRIQAKFIIKTHQSIDRDQIEYYVQFKPSQKVDFTKEDDLYYFETDYKRKYGNGAFIGLYIDIPDDKGVYHKWLIAFSEPANQFPKYLILPCNYEFSWIEREGANRIKRRMWSALRMQNSYNSGLYTNYTFSKQENQDKVWLPLNSITEKIWYTTDDSKNMRVLVSVPTENPLAWTISKIENMHPIGIQKLTLYQTIFNPHKDYLEKDSSGNIIGMWADYWSSELEPTEANPSVPLATAIKCKINSSTQNIKVGGSYKLLAAQFYDKGGADVTENLYTSVFSWDCKIDGKDVSDKVTWLAQKGFNKIKIKFANDRSYLNKVLYITCKVHYNSETIVGKTQLEITV